MSSIPTTYNGIRFRSRLEAKWACFFNQVGWRWHYEPIDLNGWIPDFLIETKGLPLLVEVKPISKMDPAITTKIHRAMGLDVINGEIFPFHKNYEFLICGIGPFEPENDRNAIGWINDCFIGDFADAVLSRPSGTKVWGLTSGIVGEWRNRIADDYGKHTSDYCNLDEIQPLWAEACNTTQWKAPRGRK